MEVSLSRLIERTPNSLTLDFQHLPQQITGKAAYFDLLYKMLLEISFDCRGSAGEIEVHTDTAKQLLRVSFILHYPQAFYNDELSLISFFGETEESTRRKSIETTIVNQILRQYRGTFKLIRIDEQTEKLELFFHNNEEAQ